MSYRWIILNLAIKKDSLEDLKYFVRKSNLEEKNELGETPLIKGNLKLNKTSKLNTFFQASKLERIEIVKSILEQIRNDQSELITAMSFWKFSREFT